ncbi:MAG: excinuclease ABC subunit UvrA [Blastocatellia bacterium]|nr:excinuclease ABC subunit UvrA [Blastocatellia bacterium]
MLEKIVIRGARQHNLKNINLDIPRNRLTVITGLSGSGKSSLAFDTIYAEGQRRYVESLSAYARQFLDQLEKPDVDLVEGLSPAISIEQKTTSRSPRSTVGTVTEIYDYLRLLFSSIGQPVCHQCGQQITRQSLEQIIANILELPEGERVMILAPVVRGRKGEFRKELEKLVKDGFLRARIDGEMRQLDEDIKLDKRKNHTIEVLVDRLLIKPGIQKRLSDSVATAAKLTDGIVLVSIVDGSEKLYSEKMTCINCGISVAALEPRSFSFNSSYGACKACQGIGTLLEVDPERLISDSSKAVEELDFIEGDKELNEQLREALLALLKQASITSNKLFSDLPEKVREEFFYGTKEKIKFTHGGYTYSAPWEGAVHLLRRRYDEAKTEKSRAELEVLISPKACRSCGGKRLRPESLAVCISSRSIADYAAMPIAETIETFEKIQLSAREEKVAGVVLKEIKARLVFLNKVGLGYLSLDRAASTLSGGEGQRIRLATQIGSQLRGVLYVLDEPSIGLHPRDNQRLIETLVQLRDIGNTVIVVEHDEETIRRSDHIVDLGPGAGSHGGLLVAQGTVEEVMQAENSLTGQYLSGKVKIAIPKKRRMPNSKALKVVGATANNLKKIDVSFPLGLFTVVTGVSGSGKSTLVNDILYLSLAKKLYQSKYEPGEHTTIEGTELIDKVIEIDQLPIGRTPRSNPATYTGVFTPIRELYASLPESKERGYKAGRFSFNVKGGRCEACQGDGLKCIEMNFLPDVYVLCDVCQGARYNRETLAVKYNGLSIAELLDKTVEESLEILDAIPQIKQKLHTLKEVGLGYIKLGQAATTLSGGEAQRIKLAKELSRRATGRTFYILDEPTTGLHFEDVRRLLDVLQQLVDMGNTVVVIEHNLDVIKSADWIIDLGPEGGSSGGRIVAEGIPEDVARAKRSYTGHALSTLPEFAGLNGCNNGNNKR